MASGLMNPLTREVSVKTIQHLGAAATAIAITFSIVWAVAAYAYERPAEAGMSALQVLAYRLL